MDYEREAKEVAAWAGECDQPTMERVVLNALRSAHLKGQEEMRAQFEKLEVVSGSSLMSKGTEGIEFKPIFTYEPAYQITYYARRERYDAESTNKVAG